MGGSQPVRAAPPAAFRTSGRAATRAEAGAAVASGMRPALPVAEICLSAGPARISGRCDGSRAEARPSRRARRPPPPAPSAPESRSLGRPQRPAAPAEALPDPRADFEPRSQEPKASHSKTSSELSLASSTLSPDPRSESDAHAEPSGWAAPEPMARQANSASRAPCHGPQGRPRDETRIDRRASPAAQAGLRVGPGCCPAALRSDCLTA